VAYSPTWTFVAAGAVLAATLLIAVKRVRAGAAAGGVVRHALWLGCIASLGGVGIVTACALEDASRRDVPGHTGVAVIAVAAAVACALVALRDLGGVVVVHRTAALARGARPPSAPLAGETPAFDFGIGDDVAVVEKARGEPYRQADRALRAFFGSAARALGAVHRASALEWVGVAWLAAIAAIVWRPRPIPPPIVTETARESLPPEPELLTVWRAPSLGEARLVAGGGSAVVALSSNVPAAWSLHTIDLATDLESAWTATPARAALWTGLHTSDGFHALDGSFEHDLERYASDVASKGGDPLVAVSSESIVYARRDNDEGPTRLWIADREGRRARLLDARHVASASPAFSRDQRRLAWIAWTERVAAEGYSLVVAKPDGGDARVAGAHVADFGWAKDGRLVAHTMDHDRECVVAPRLRHCIQSARLGALFWDADHESVAWVGFAGNSLAYEWVRLATGEVLAHGAVPDGNAYADALLDSGEHPALFVVAGRGSPTRFVLERVDLATGAIRDVVSSFQPAASGRGVLSRGVDGAVLFVDRPDRLEVRLMRLRARP
jgi:hypothetical protein